MGDSFQTQRGVTLPRLERLFVVDTDTYRISSFLEQLSTPNSVEFDLISVDWNRRTLLVSGALYIDRGSHNGLFLSLSI